MKGLKYGFGLILVGGFALTASCGGSASDSSSGTPSAGTSASSAGTSSSSGGSSSTAGTSSGSGGTGTSTAGAGTGTSGSSATGGTGPGSVGNGGASGGGRTGAGGTAATNPAGCPPATPTPKSGDACTPNTNNRLEMCSYEAANPGEELECQCQAPRRGQGGGEAGAADMPDGTLTCAITCAPRTSAPPKTGDACSIRGQCAFGTLQDGLTTCTCQNMKWTCREFTLGAAGAGF